MRYILSTGFILSLFLCAIIATAVPAQQGGIEEGTAATEQKPSVHPGSLQVNLAFLSFGLHDDDLVIRRRFRVTNPTAKAVMGQQGAFRIDLPAEAAGQETVTVNPGEASQTIRAVAAEDGQGYWIDYPIEPGDTLIDVEYPITFRGNGQVYEEKFFQRVGIFQVYVHPTTLVAKGKQLIPIRLNEEAGWIQYHTTSGFEPGEVLRLTLASASVALPPGHPPMHRGRIEEVLPRIARYQVPIIAATTLLLLLAAAASRRIGTGSGAGQGTD